MRPHRLLPCPVAVMVLLGAVSPVAAQQDFGTITEARSVLVSLLGLCWGTRADAGPGAQVEIQRRQQRLSASPPTRVEARDRVRVHHRTNARLSVAPGAANGTLYMAPGLICFPEIAADTVVRGLRLRQSQSAEYEVFRDSVVVDGRRQERFGIAIERGALIVDWYPGAPLFVLAAGDTATITGTVAAVAVDSAGAEGLFYLHSGSATITRHGSLVAGQLLHLRGALPPVPLPRPEVVAGLQEAIRAHAPPVTGRLQVASNRGFDWTRAAIIGGAVLAGSGMIACAATTCWDPGPEETRTRTGTVILRLPLWTQNGGVR